jgi:predicted RNA polymerase sigma factor
VDDELLAQEVMVGCTQGMLLRLDREHRMAFVLGEVLGFSGDEAADVCGIAPAAFRKRLQRARERISSSSKATVDFSTRTTRAVAGGGSAPQSGAGEWIPEICCSHIASTRSS